MACETLQNGRYVILKKLGEGRKGIVYKARDTFSNRVVAIKILKSAFLGEEAYLRFLREAQATAKLRHSNIVSIYDIGKEGEKQFFVLQLVDGMSLRDLMATYPEGKCDIQTILRTGMDVCRALQYAHSQGVLHRDIKPENILITQEGIAKLMDLGLASLLSSLARVQDIPRKSMILLVGPPGAGKSAFCHWTVLRNLATNKPVIFVTTEHAPSDVIRCLQEKGLSEIPPGTLSFVDAFHETMGLPATSRPDTVNAHCGDLTSIEVAISKLQDKISTNNVLLIFDSLTSPYLLNGEEIIKFLRLSLAKFAAKGNQVLACMDEGCGKEEDLVAMMSMATGIIKMELEDGSCALNVVKHPVVEPTRIRYQTTETLDRPGIAQERIIVGTAAYVAPEIALGEAADARSDLYSFGAVLYEMATGKPPFHGEDPVRNISSHIHDQPISPSKLNPKIPQALAECITKLLEKEPGKRYQNAADLLKVLRKIAENFVREVSVRSLKPSVAVPSTRLPAMKETQLIDRVEEISLLRKAVDRVVRGEGHVVFLYGEAGIGKTRLAGELGAYARLRGMQVLYGKCPALFAMDGVPPYILWKELIKNYLEVSTPEQLYGVIGFYPAEVSKLVPQLRQKLGAVPQSLPISPEHERDRLFEAVSQFVFNISKEEPLLIVLDDLQWADQSSLLLLHYLAHGVYKESLLLLGAYRDTYVDEHHPLSPVLTELNRERLLQSVPLKRLSFDDVLEMIRQILEQDDVSREFCELVYERTRGNPFFVEEVIKSLKEEEVIYREEGKWKIKEVSRIEFPKTVKSVIKKRVSRLDTECQNALTLASFVGRDFAFEALCGITGVEEDRLLEIMEKILKTGLVKERVIRGQDVYSFSDIIVKDVVHEGISRLRHNKLHGVVGCALEKVYAKNIDEHLGELALHFLESGDKKKALDYFLKAGEKAVKVYANSEAASYFQSALRFLEEEEGELRKRGSVLERLGDIKRLVGEHDACMKYWDDALLLWKQLGERRKICILHRKIANVFWDEMNNTEKAKEHYNNALKILETERESIELASLYEDMAHMYYRTGNMAKALSSAEKALELAEKLNGLEVVASSYASLGTVFSFTADRKKAIACLEKALEIALAEGQLETALRAYTNLPLSLPVEENERILECYEKGYELAKKAGHIYHQSWIGNNLAWMYLNMGNTNKAVLLAEESVALDRKADNISHICMPMGVLGFAYQILGELDKSEQFCQEALSISQRLKDFQSIGISYWSLGWHHFDRGEYVKAKEFFEKGCEVYEKAGAKYWQMGYSRWVVWTYIELGEIGKAKNLIDDLRKFALEVKDKELIAAVDALRAMQFRAQKKWKESIEHFEKSIQEHKALNARRWDVYFFAKMILYEYARVYLERRHEGDREKAHNLLSQALEIFQKIGAKKDIEKIMAKKETPHSLNSIDRKFQ